MTAPDLPQIAVSCPDCGAEPGDPCTSHDGTRIRHHNTHQTRRKAWEAAAMAAVTLKPIDRTDTIVMTFEVLHDPTKDSQYDIEYPTYNWHKPVSVEARWVYDGADALWKLVSVIVRGARRDRATGKLFKNSLHALPYTAMGNRYDNMQYLPAWLAEDLAARTPTHQAQAATS